MISHSSRGPEVLEQHIAMVPAQVSPEVIGLWSGEAAVTGRLNEAGGSIINTLMLPGCGRLLALPCGPL